MPQAAGTMLSHRIRERKYFHVGTCICSAVIVGSEKPARKGEYIEAVSVRIDSIGRPIRAIPGDLPEEIDGRELVLGRSAGKQSK